MGAASRLRGRCGGERSNLIPHSSQYSLPSMLLVAQLLHLIMRLALRAPGSPANAATRLYSRPYVASIKGIIRRPSPLVRNQRPRTTDHGLLTIISFPQLILLQPPVARTPEEVSPLA